MIQKTIGLLLTASLCSPCWAFSALVSPPRVEARSDAGKTYRSVIEITNTSTQAERYSFKTADWTLDAHGGAVFQDTLMEGSCRQWVAIQARDATLKPNQRIRYRFEVQVPADAPAGECRFALMIEGEAKVEKGSAGIPVSGQIGVIVYLAVGDAKSKAVLEHSGTQLINQQQLPFLQIYNQGLAHARLSGLIEGTDAAGQGWTFTPTSDPILPQLRRNISLQPIADPERRRQTIQYPLHLKGSLDNQQQGLPIDVVIQPTTP